MKTLQDLKNEYAVEQGFLDWDQYCICTFGAHLTDTLDNLFFKVAKEALENAYKTAIVQKKMPDILGGSDIKTFVRESVLKETNIPKL